MRLARKVGVADWLRTCGQQCAQNLTGSSLDWIRSGMPEIVVGLAWHSGGTSLFNFKQRQPGISVSMVPDGRGQFPAAQFRWSWSLSTAYWPAT